MHFSTFRCERNQSFTMRTQCSGGTRPRDFSVTNTVILCPLCWYFCTLHIQFIPRYCASFTCFSYVSFLPHSLHFVSTACINFRPLSKLTLSRLCVARFTAERRGPFGVFPASYSEGSGFKSRPRHLPAILTVLVVLLNSSRQM